MKLNKKLVDQLAKGEIAVINDGSLKQLKEILLNAFPKDNYRPKEDADFYASRLYDKDCWQFGNPQNLKKVSISKFYEMEKEIIGYKLIKPEYREAANSILDGFGYFLDDEELGHDKPIKIMEEAGVLALWFKPIYKEEDFRVGDVVVKEWNCSGDIDIFEVSKIEYGELYSNEYLINWSLIEGSVKHPSAPLKKDSRFNMRHATPQEKEKYLMDKANREYPKGTKYFSAYIDCLEEEQYVSGYFEYDSLDNAIYDKGMAVYFDGKWAEKIERQLPKIGELEGVETKCHIKYGNKNLSKKCLRQMEAFGIMRIMVATEIYSIVSETELSELYKSAKK